MTWNHAISMIVSAMTMSSGSCVWVLLFGMVHAEVVQLVPTTPTAYANCPYALCQQPLQLVPTAPTACADSPYSLCQLPLQLGDAWKCMTKTCSLMYCLKQQQTACIMTLSLTQLQHFACKLLVHPVHERPLERSPVCFVEVFPERACYAQVQ